MYSIDEYNRGLAHLMESGAKVSTIGHSTLGRDIHLVTKGEDSDHIVLIHGCIHAREYITTPLLLEMMAKYSGKAMICLIPCVNVDGMRLVIEGLSSIDDIDRAKWLYDVNNHSDDFSLWKANANAVDLNVNFNADWGRGKSNITHPASANYIGKYPMSEVESRILAGVTLRLQPKITLSYHTKGNVIYHGYKDNLAYVSIARDIANFINYDLLQSSGSFGGYKDWFMATTPYLGLTIECGDDAIRHPLPMSELAGLVARHDSLLDYVAKRVYDIR